MSPVGRMPASPATPGHPADARGPALRTPTFQQPLAVVHEELRERRPLRPLQGVQELLDFGGHSAVHRDTCQGRGVLRPGHAAPLERGTRKRGRATGCTNAKPRCGRHASPRQTGTRGKQACSSPSFHHFIVFFPFFINMPLMLRYEFTTVIFK